MDSPEQVMAVSGPSSSMRRVVASSICLPIAMWPFSGWTSRRHCRFCDRAVTLRGLLSLVTITINTAVFLIVTQCSLVEVLILTFMDQCIVREIV
jgi:hypothetical protein